MVRRSWKRSSSTISARTTGTAALRITSRNAESIWKGGKREARPGELVFSMLVVIGLSLLAAIAIVAVIWQKMDNISEKATANAYVAAGLRLTEQTDRFTIRRPPAGRSSAAPPAEEAVAANPAAAARAEAENSDLKGAAMKTTHKQVLALLLAVASAAVALCLRANSAAQGLRQCHIA